MEYKSKFSKGEKVFFMSGNQIHQSNILSVLITDKVKWESPLVEYEVYDNFGEYVRVNEEHCFEKAEEVAASLVQKCHDYYENIKS